MMFLTISHYIIRHLFNIDQRKFRYFSIIPSLSIKLNLTMKKLIDSKKYREALDHFDRQSQISNDRTFTLALKACTKLYDHQRGIRIHQQLSSQLLEDSFIQTALIHFYMQCHDIDHANRIFSAIDKKTIFMYGVMFKGYLSNEMPEKVLELFDQMSLKPDDVIITILFNACAKLANAHAIKFGKDMLDRLPTSFLQDCLLVNSAIDMLMKFGDVTHAERLFQQMKKKTIVTYGTMMQGYKMNDLSEKALNLFEEISSKSNEFIYAIVYSACASLSNERATQLGKKYLHQMPTKFLDDIVVVTSAIHMLMKFGEVKDAECLVPQIKKPTLYSYGVIMNGYNINEEPHKCLKIFEQIKRQNLKIDVPISMSLIGACSQIRMRSICRNLVDQIPVHLQNDPHLKVSLISMWGKAADLDRAKEIFQSISQPDVFSFTSMINAYGRNGMGSEAIDLYQQMPEVIRNPVSHICVLNACSHSGFLDQARIIFSQIDTKTEEIITTMVDCLSRMCMFDEGQELIDDYEKSNSPSPTMYMTMLSGARNHRHVVLSQKLYDRMKSLFPDQKPYMIAASILVSNTHLSVGNSQEAQEIRANRIKKFGKKIQVGFSMTEVNGELVVFKAHDRSHPRSDEIYDELDRLSSELIKHGHDYDSSSITRPLKDGENIESVLCGHSEKLAIAFNMIQRPRPSFIQITKNLRVCGDCHRAMKMIAKIRQCEIIVADTNRNHHFHTNGQCSCQDYF